MSKKSGKCGESLDWCYDESTRELTISGTGEMYDFDIDGDNRPWAKYASEVKSISISREVRSIGSQAFCRFSSLESIVIPLFVGEIGDTAFADCVNLKQVHFMPNTSGNITVEIGFGAFWGCENLEIVTMPIKGDITECTFYNCHSLRSIRIPEGTAIIDNETFSGCNNLVDVRMPKTIERIELNAFEGCNKLETLTWKKSNQDL